MDGKRQTRVYVAGAYSADNVMDVLRNMRVGINASMQVLVAGYAPFCPHLDYHFVLAEREPNAPLVVADFYRYSMTWLEASDCMVIVSGYGTSKGVLAEYERAQLLGIPIYQSLEELFHKEPKWRER